MLKKGVKTKMVIRDEVKLMQYRLNRLLSSEKNIKSPGVVRKLERKIRNLQRES